MIADTFQHFPREFRLLCHRARGWQLRSSQLKDLGVSGPGGESREDPPCSPPTLAPQVASGAAVWLDLSGLEAAWAVSRHRASAALRVPRHQGEIIKLGKDSIDLNFLFLIAC